MVFVDQVSAAVPVFLALTRSKVWALAVQNAAMDPLHDASCKLHVPSARPKTSPSL